MSAGWHRRGTTLAELLVAAPIGLGALGVGLVVSMVWLARIAGAVADPVLAAVPVLEALRADVRQARAVVFPRAGDVDVAARGLVLRARDGRLVGWRVEGGVLVRTVIGAAMGGAAVGGAVGGAAVGGAESAAGRSGARAGRWELRGVERLAVRRLGGKRALVRVGLLRAERAVVLLSAAPWKVVAGGGEPDVEDEEDGA